MGISAVSEDSISVHMAGGDYLSSVGLSQLFDASGFVDVTGRSSFGTEAVEQVKAEQPDIVLMDALISEHGMAETTAAISGMSSWPKVVILSASDGCGAMEPAFRAGACGYLVRGSTLEDIAAALRIVHRGGLVNSLMPACARGADMHRADDEEALARFKSLNVRDLSIIAALADGHTNAQISRLLHLSEATVKARLTQLMQQLGMENRVQIAVAAVKAGLHAPEQVSAQ